MITFTFYFMGAAAIMDFPQIQPFCGSLRLGTSMDNEVHILGMLHAKFHVLFTIWTIYHFDGLITCTNRNSFSYTIYFSFLPNAVQSLIKRNFIVSITKTKDKKKRAHRRIPKPVKHLRLSILRKYFRKKLRFKCLTDF